MKMANPAGARAAALAAVIMWLAAPAAQEPVDFARDGPGRVSSRTVISDLSAPAIDQGLRGADLPRAAAIDNGGRLGRRQEPFLRGSVVVKFRPGTSIPAHAAMLKMVQGASTPGLSYADFDIVAVDPGADPEALARRLSAQPDVVYAQARYLVRPRFVPNDPFYQFQWNYPALDMERAWDINRGAASAVTVAILDTGMAFRSFVLRFVTSSRQIPFMSPSGQLVLELFPSLGTIDVPFAPAPDLASADRFVRPHDFIWDDSDPVDMDGHGTHVAGTIGQLTDNSVGGAGMAFNVRLMPVKILDTFWDEYFGSPFSGTDDLLARGIRYAADNGAHVLNLSVGRTGPAAPVVQQAVAYAVSRGAFVSVAGGNEFLEGNSIERFAEFAPLIDGMVAVASVGRDLRRASYSSTGSYVELVAPGGDASRGGTAAAILQQTFNFDLTDTFFDGPARFRAPRFDAFAYHYFQGTSMAAPHVSGFAALLIQQGITNPTAIEAAMKRFAIDLGPAGRDDEYGYGLISPRATLRGMGLAR